MGGTEEVVRAQNTRGTATQNRRRQRQEDRNGGRLVELYLEVMLEMGGGSRQRLAAAGGVGRCGTRSPAVSQGVVQALASCSRFAVLNRELSRAGVTNILQWQEYKAYCQEDWHSTRQCLKLSAIYSFCLLENV